jgi:hypothetical protein
MAEATRLKCCAPTRSSSAAKSALSAERVSILVLRIHTGQTGDAVRDVANKHCVTETLRPALAEDAVLRTDGGSLPATVAREMGIERQAVNTLRGERERGAPGISRSQCVPRPFHGRCHPLPGQLPRLFPPFGPQCPVRCQAHHAIGSGHRRSMAS